MHLLDEHDGKRLGIVDRLALNRFGEYQVCGIHENYLFCWYYRVTSEVRDVPNKEAIDELNRFLAEEEELENQIEALQIMLDKADEDAKTKQLQSYIGLKPKLIVIARLTATTLFLIPGAIAYVLDPHDDIRGLPKEVMNAYKSAIFTGHELEKWRPDHTRLWGLKCKLDDYERTKVDRLEVLRDKAAEPIQVETGNKQVQLTTRIYDIRRPLKPISQKKHPELYNMVPRGEFLDPEQFHRLDDLVNRRMDLTKINNSAEKQLGLKLDAHDTVDGLYINPKVTIEECVTKDY